MEVFPDAHTARLCCSVASVAGAVAMATVSSTSDESTTLTTWLAVITLSVETVLIATQTAHKAAHTWEAAATVLWLGEYQGTTIADPFQADAIYVSRVSAFHCALAWSEWLLLTARFLLLEAEMFKLQLRHLAKALMSKLRPWWNAIKEPFVQIAASVVVLLSGVVVSLGASVGLLATGLFGLVDRALGVVGLGGMREKAFRSLGLYKVVDGVEGVFSTLGLGGVFADGNEEPNTVGNTVGATANDVGRLVTGNKLL
ncbi:hypothetical protein CspeluHIS016_0200040 [Cutaneotrichosporon spelunceum]|uniref:Uncharacterized protein n=1 Tax=Cutaneotrichosporon spelunceum TaxID=1672016 RepID=A0AAD3TQP0_9TREE|nr:hypothetical protein CspeluHIS016_0200040 [Cutaneotrichosporon spelunceum]